MAASSSRTNPDLLALVTAAQKQLTQLEGVAKGLVNELAASGAHATPRLRELLATGEGLVAAVQKATGQLGPTLPDGSSLPPGPSRSATEAVWASQQQERAQTPATLPIPVAHPAASLSELAASLAHLPACTLQLLTGPQPAPLAAAASGVLLRCGRAFVAVVQLEEAGGLQPLRVSVVSVAEAGAALDGSGSLWAPSRHAVFQRLSALAAAAMGRYLAQPQAPGQPSALELLLLWLAGHGDLFTRRSDSSGTLLLADLGSGGGALQPPLRRPVLLGWQELWQAALNPHLRQAEHLGEA